MTRKHSKLLAFVYIAMMSVAFVVENYNGPVWFLKDILWGVTTCIGIAVVFVSGNFRHIKKISIITGAGILQYLFILAISLLIWIAERQSIPLMRRGAITLVYQINAIIAMAAAVYMFEEKALYYTFYSMVLANTFIMITVMQSYGVWETLKSIFFAIITFGGFENKTVTALEVHDLTFAFGVFLLYFTMLPSHIKKPVLHIVLAAFFFLLGMKRIALAQMIVLIPFWYILINRKFKKSSFVNFTAVIILFFCLWYVYLIYSDGYGTLMDAMNVNTMGRDRIYRVVAPYYEFSPAYLGHGTGFVQRTMEDLFLAGNSPALGLHADILMLFIELGFFGMIFWILIQYVLKYKIIKSVAGEEVMLLSFLVSMYAFFTYITDNTFLYCYTNLAIAFIPTVHMVKIQNDELRKWI